MPLPSPLILRHLAIATLLATVVACKPASPPEATGSTEAPVRETPTKPVTRDVHEVGADKLGVTGTANAMCALGPVDGQPFTDGSVTLSARSSVVFRGWLADAATQSRPTAPFLRIEQRDGSRAWEFPLNSARDRQDVVDAYGAATLLNTGFVAKLSLTRLPPGNYQINLVHYVDGQRFDCSDRGRRRLVLTPR